MSTSALEMETRTPPKPLPVGVSNLLTYWWLTIACVIIAAWAFWSEMPPPVTTLDKGEVRTVTGSGSALYGLVMFGLRGLGGFAAYMIVTHRRIGLLILKLGAIVAMILGVAFLGLASLTAKGGFTALFEPTPLFTAALLIMMVMLPVIFGMMTLLTLGSAEGINEFFAEGGAAPETGATGQYVVPAAFGAAAAAGGGAAVAETLAYRHEPEGATPLHEGEVHVDDAAFDDAIKEAVMEESSEHEV